MGVKADDEPLSHPADHSAVNLSNIVRTLVDEVVVFTGAVDVDGERTPRRDLVMLARRAGANASTDQRARVTSSTTLLVRGHRGEWKHGHYGTDEESVSELQADGYNIRIIDESGFSSLLRGGWAQTIKPHHDASSVLPWTSPYRPGAVTEDAEPVRSEADRREANAAHNALQDSIADLAAQRGFLPLSPTHPRAQFDVGWEDADGGLHIVEVKSLNTVNEDRQVRLGLGQILDYGLIFDGRARLAVALSAAPSRDEHWTELGDCVGVRVVWPGRLDELFRSE